MRHVSKQELQSRSMFLWEKRLIKEGFSRVAGVDEAGRGPLAGPVVAAACILPKGAKFPGINDSKQLTPEERDNFYEAIVARSCYAIGTIDVETIDRINILQATFLAMQQAVSSLSMQPDYLLIDGNQKPYFSIPSETIVKGDARSVSIAAASILAKVTRDRIMKTLDDQWPGYGFKRHKGYGTPEHLEAISRLGPCPVHRKSFSPIRIDPNRQFEFSF